MAGNVAVTPSSRTIAVGPNAAVLEPRVMQVLVLLGRRCGEVVGRDALATACWDDRIVGDDAINRAVLKLRRALDEIGGTPVVETVAKVGYRLAVAVEPAVVEPPPTGAALSADAAPTIEVVPAPPAGAIPAVATAVTAAPPTTRRSTPRRVAAWTAAGLGVALVAAAIAGSQGQADRRLVVVAPLRVAAGDASARRVAQDLAGDLSRVTLGHDTRLAFADAGRDAHAAFTVTGSVATIGRDLHAVVAIGTGDDPTILWSHDYTAPADAPAALRQQVSTNLAAVLVCAAGTRGLGGDTDRRVFALYFEACNLHSGDQRQEIFLLRQVLASAPRFAGAWSDLAIALSFATDRERTGDLHAMRREASAAAAHALALDPHQGNAYYARTLMLPGLRNWTARRRILLAGLAAQPDNPQLYARLAVDLAAIGRLGDSIVAGRRAVTLDPLFPGKAARLVRSLTSAGKRDEADEAVRRMQAIWPDNPYTWSAAFDAAARLGDARTAAALLAHPLDATTADEAAAWQAFLDAKLTPTPAVVDRAVATLTAAEQRGVVSGPQLVDDIALLGRPTLALRLALALPPKPDSELWFDAALAPVRADPRFMEVAARQGLTAIWRATRLWPDFCGDPALRYRCSAAAAAHG
ncbi:MAG: winged helix-turn-helix domain-containing protein [Sphingomonadaceae bacterium]|nr:winged helix-turn-helix domain-containing protein [Sphingomonadaceae bacterium]